MPDVDLDDMDCRVYTVNPSHYLEARKSGTYSQQQPYYIITTTLLLLLLLLSSSSFIFFFLLLFVYSAPIGEIEAIKCIHSHIKYDKQ